MSANPPAAAQEPRPVSGRGIKPVVSLRAHRKVAAAAFAAVVVLGTPVAWVKGKSFYETSAVIRVHPRFLKNMEGDQELELQSNSQYREFVQQQVRTINRHDIALEALAKLGPRRFEIWQLKKESDRRAAERLQGALRISPVPDTYLVTIGMEQERKEGLDLVVNAVVETYLGKVHGEEFWAVDRRSDSLVKQRADLVQQILSRERERTEIAQKLGVTTFSGSDLNPYDKLVMSAREALDTSRRKRIEVEAQLAAVDGGQREGGNEALAAAAQDAVAKDPTVSGIRGSLLRRRTDLILQLTGLTQEHPARRAAVKELAEIEAEIRALTEPLEKEVKETLLTLRRTDVFQAKQIESAYTAVLEERMAEATTWADLYNRALSLTADLDRERKRLDSIDNRLAFLSSESQAPGFVRLVSKALPPELPSKGGKRPLLLGVLVAALGVALVVPVAIDVLDPRLHAPGDLEKLAGFAPLGWVIDRRDPATEELSRDQLRRLASRLEMDVRESGTRVWVLTSAKPREGVTTLALDLGLALDAIGVGTVTVEANAFDPDPRLSGSAPGLADVLAGRASLPDGLLARGDGVPARLGVGDLGGERHLPHLERLPEVFRKLRESFEVVLLSGPPLLLSADTELLVTHAGAALLVVEAAATARPVVKRALRVLESLKPPVVGVVLNRVRIFEGGGYFGELLSEYATRRSSPPKKSTSPWLWS